ncbi:MAG: DUF5683 domain-containing protein [Saprospiraceae bacterium]|nr:hypothetical protein [Candidatus Vicinibacter proximus]HRG32861.1 DUF5683 domain-containing protein [Saprospiraceae bacterium]
MKFLYCFSALYLLFGLLNLKAQDSTQILQDKDTTSVSSNSKKTTGTLKNIFKGKPGRALTYSLLLPGAGQIYNKKYWKLPLVYSALGFPIYLISFNKSEYDRFDKAYRMRIDLKENSTDEFVGILEPSAIDSYRSLYDKNLQRSYLALVGAYLLIGIEAFVDRHLMEFDVSDDLSMSIYPSAGFYASGITMQIKLK